MRKRNTSAFEENVKLGSVEQACQRYALGRNRMRDIATEAQAVVRIGRRWLVNFSVMDDYFDALSGK
jgi:hypothetical protein